MVDPRYPKVVTTTRQFVAVRQRFQTRDRRFYQLPDRATVNMGPLPAAASCPIRDSQSSVACPAGMRQNQDPRAKYSQMQDEHPMSTNDPEFYQAPKFTPEPPRLCPSSAAVSSTGASSRACWRFWWRSCWRSLFSLLYRCQPVGRRVHRHGAARASQGRDAGRTAAGRQGSSRGVPQGRRGGNAHRAARIDQRRPQCPDRAERRA